MFAALLAYLAAPVCCCCRRAGRRAGGRECDTEETRKRRAPQETQGFDAGRERKSDVQIERGRKKKSSIGGTARRKKHINFDATRHKIRLLYCVRSKKVALGGASGDGALMATGRCCFTFIS